MIARVFRRVFRPAAFALALAALFLAGTWLGLDRFPGPFDAVLGGVAAATAAVLFLAWWWDSDRGRRAGFLLSVGLWSAVSAAAFLTLTGWTSGLLAVAWAVLAAGSYWAEVSDGVAV